MDKSVRVTVVYPVTFTTLIDTDRDIGILREQVKGEADLTFHQSSVDPMITHCEEYPELEE